MGCGASADKAPEEDEPNIDAEDDEDEERRLEMFMKEAEEEE